MSPAQPSAPRGRPRRRGDAAADAGADLDEQEVVDRAGDAGVLLAERHDVDVVVDQHRAAELAGERVPDREAVPARHDRRRDRDAVAEADRAGHAGPGPREGARGVGGAQLADHLQRAADDDLGAPPDVDRLGLVREHPQLAVGDGDVDRGGADVDAEEAGVAGDPHDRGAAAAAGRGEAGGLDQAELDQAVELDREPGPGQLDRVAELGPGARSVVAQQPQEPRLLRVVRPHHRHAGDGTRTHPAGPGYRSSGSASARTSA